MVPKQRRFASSLRWLVAVTWDGRLGKVEGRKPAYPGVRKETANCSMVVWREAGPRRCPEFRSPSPRGLLARLPE